MAFNKESFEHFWQHLDVLFGRKVDKVAGKGLSSNDFTNEDKEKLNSLEEYVQDIKTLTSDPREGDSETPELSAVPINADKLGGIDASEYALKSEIPSTLVMNYTALFPTTGWEGDVSPFTQTVTVEGILATDNPIVDIDMSNAMSDDDSALAVTEWSFIRRIVANNGSVTMYCYDEIPTKDIHIILKVVR